MLILDLGRDERAAGLEGLDLLLGADLEVLLAHGVVPVGDGLALRVLRQVAEGQGRVLRRERLELVAVHPDGVAEDDDGLALVDRVLDVGLEVLGAREALGGRVDLLDDALLVADQGADVLLGRQVLEEADHDGVVLEDADVVLRRVHSVSMVCQICSSNAAHL